MFRKLWEKFEGFVSMHTDEGFMLRPRALVLLVIPMMLFVFGAVRAYVAQEQIIDYKEQTIVDQRSRLVLHQERIDELEQTTLFNGSISITMDGKPFDVNRVAYNSKICIDILSQNTTAIVMNDENLAGKVISTGEGMPVSGCFNANSKFWATSKYVRVKVFTYFGENWEIPSNGWILYVYELTKS